MSKISLKSILKKTFKKNKATKSKKKAKISLLAKPHAIDWVQILKVNI